MTLWTPDLAGRSGPIYRQIAAALVEEIQTGELPAGTRLPPQRDLARTLGVTVGTVGRAYSEAERRGCIAGQVGRGTYVLSAGERRGGLQDLGLRARVDGAVDLSLNLPPESTRSWAGGNQLAETLGRLASEQRLDRLLRYQPNAGSKRHREAGSLWLRQFGLDASPEDVLVIQGAQHGLMVALSALTRPGETVLCEELTYPGLQAVAGLLGLRLHGVALDSEGLVPRAVEAAHRRTGARVLYAVPTIQNPTGRSQSLERRQALAEVVERLDLVLIEDDVHSTLLGQGGVPEAGTNNEPGVATPVATWAPASTLYISSLSKCVAPGLRVGYLMAPPSMVDRLTRSLWATVWGVAPLMAEVAAQWIEDGTAYELTAERRDESARRQAIVFRELAARRVEGHEKGLHVWLHLPEERCEKELALALRSEGVVVTPGSAFAVGSASGQARVPALRICHGAAEDDAALVQALQTIDRQLETPKRGLAPSVSVSM